MLGAMSKKVRVGLLIDEETRDILKLEALLAGGDADMGDIVMRLVKDHCPESREQIRKRRGDPKGKGKSDPGRVKD